MAASFDPFEILGVRPDATPEQIRAAYRELALRYHPDKHRGNPLEELAAAKLVEINRAYEMLTRPGARAAGGGHAPRGEHTPRASASGPNAGMKLLRSLG